MQKKGLCCDLCSRRPKNTNLNLTEAENKNWSVPFGGDANSWQPPVQKVAGAMEPTQGGDGLSFPVSQRSPGLPGWLRTPECPSCLVGKHSC